METNNLPDFANMNETDVREEIVRPLITRLGYKHGSEAYVQTELKLTYSAAFLGRKKPLKDPPLQGRADYVCGVIATGRWVIEVKSPSEDVDEASIQQAHTYAAHPEVAAYYFMVTNGREFRVFETGRLNDPILSWQFGEMDTKFLNVSNVLGPQAIAKRSRLITADPGEPLGPGIHSKLEILNGKVIYTSNQSATLASLVSSLDNVELPVSGGMVSRDKEGRIHANVSIASVAPLMRQMGAMGLSDEYDFYSSDRYISIDEGRPTIFQNFVRKNISQGTQGSFLGAHSAIPFQLDFEAFTEVVGFVNENQFEGTMRIEGELVVGSMNPFIQKMMLHQLGLTPGRHRISQSGSFYARLGPAV